MKMTNYGFKGREVRRTSTETQVPDDDRHSRVLNQIWTYRYRSACLFIHPILSHRFVLYSRQQRIYHSNWRPIEMGLVDRFDTLYVTPQNSCICCCMWHTRDKRRIHWNIRNSPFPITPPPLRCVDGAQLTHGSQDCRMGWISLWIIFTRGNSFPTGILADGFDHWPRIFLIKSRHNHKFTDLLIPAAKFFCTLLMSFTFPAESSLRQSIFLLIVINSYNVFRRGDKTEECGN